MKKNISITTPEAFQATVAQMEAKSRRLKGIRKGRSLSAVLNILYALAAALLSVCVLFTDVNLEGAQPAEAFSHIPDFVDKAGLWTWGLFPEGTPSYICLAVLLGSCLVFGLITGLIFRLIPFRGKQLRSKGGETPEEQINSALTLADSLKSTCYGAQDVYFTGIILVAFLVPVVVLILPIVSIVRAMWALSWSAILFGVLTTLVQMFLPLCLLLFVVFLVCFGVTYAQEWVSSLFGKTRDWVPVRKALEAYLEQVKKEAEEQHKRELEAVAEKAIAQMIAGDGAKALRTLDPVVKKAPDADVIKRVIKLLFGKQDSAMRLSLLEEKTEKYHYASLRSYIEDRQAEARQLLTAEAEEKYPLALEQLEKENYEEAMSLLVAAHAVDYRDGVALHSYAKSKHELSYNKAALRDDILHGLEKSMESPEMEILCRAQVDYINDVIAEEERRFQERLQAKKAAEAAEAAYWVAKTRGYCTYKVGDRCCRLCNIDNFPPLCTYHDKPDDMWLCSDRKLS